MNANYIKHELQEDGSYKETYVRISSSDVEKVKQSAALYYEQISYF